ncbi:MULTISPECIES: hypothetical protein [unclassified Variovorax]|jgi:hypothetical protein|uniref:hypothetical protein n=1 Tax=Variovorax TaxID=34072 RepID=UPI0008E319B7|nr:MULTISPECIES: hypothetical protein [unclassified Variovorax]KAF1068043.1 MAG: hypothetical protein GAK39_03696 [Variovorax sp.]SFO71219.1 hypothetical protein SAMN05443579_105283 [Variovorax sp. PDC80]
MTVECKLLETPLIGRIWEGRTPIARADDYLHYSLEHGIREIARKPDCLGVQYFRRLRGNVAEFRTVSFWRSVEDMHAMHDKRGDPLRVAPLARDPEFLLELPEFVDLVEVHVNSFDRR